MTDISDVDTGAVTDRGSVCRTRRMIAAAQCSAPAGRHGLGASAAKVTSNRP